jgi:hypothetical protein
MKKFFPFVFLLLLAGRALSYDFGLLIEQKVGAENKAFSYNAAFSPWFSWNGGGAFSLYFSGVFSLKYNYYDDGTSGNDIWRKPLLLPELSRFSLRYRPGPAFRMEAGRMEYTDALGFTASGLFDGFRLQTVLPLGSLIAGMWYTGLLYKETAKVTMSAYDTKNYAEPVDDPASYLASRRLFGSLRWDMPLLEFHSLSAEVLAQFDLNGEKEILNSQYGEILVELFPGGVLGLGAGVLFEAMEKGENKFSAALGGLLRLTMDVPGSLNDGLRLTVKFGSGEWNDTFTAFTPLGSYVQGEIFPETISGLGVFSAGYTARLHQTLYLESAFRYFARTFDDPGAAGKYLYGGELWASVAWQLFDDLRLSLGSGVFLPGLGNIDPGGDPAWKLSAGLSLSF